MTKAETYALAVVFEGATDEQARARAGYVSKTPGSARELSRKLGLIVSAPADLRQSPEVYAKKARDLERRASVMRAWERAARLFLGHTDQVDEGQEV